jgi:hypothetical protein
LKSTTNFAYLHGISVEFWCSHWVRVRNGLKLLFLNLESVHLLHDGLRFIDFALLSEFFSLFNIKVDFLLELVYSLMSLLLLKSIHLRSRDSRAFSKLCSATSSRNLNTRKWSLNFVIHLRNHLLKQGL